jgi:DeoR/GlpR family transcriptional regulator of sugar metabolism
MLTSQRKQWILDRLRRDGQVIAKAAAEELAVSEDTLRRDLRELARDGALQRVHGGALPASAALGDLARRREVAPQDKVALGRAGAAMVQPGQVVILDGGTTATQVARHLPRDLAATIVTHSPGIAVELVDHPALDVILIGGRLFKHSMVSVGSAAVDAARRIRADLYFMGVTGVHPQAGLTTGDFEEAGIKRTLHEQAAETVVLASTEKLGAASAFLVLPLAEASTILVPAGTAAEMRQALSACGVSVVMVVG